MKRNRMLAALLSAALLVSLVGCGQPSSASSKGLGLQGDATLSGELAEVFTLGIADDSLRQRLKEATPCTQAEATALLCNAYQLRRTQENLYLKDMLVHAKANKAASRYWMAQGMYFSNLQERMDVEYTDYETWMNTYRDFNDEAPVPEDIRLPDAKLVARDAETGRLALFGSTWDGACPDNDKAFDASAEEGYANNEDYGSHVIICYAALLYDRTNGDKVMPLDENFNFNPQASLSVEDAILTALRYYRSFEDEQEPVAFADVGGYDTRFITSELLDRKSALPDASCEALPESWHGVLDTDLGYVAVGALGEQTDKAIHESDIKAMHDSGFNFLGLFISFSYLQGPVLQDGMLNESRLRMLDEIIGWCMKYDIHVDVRCTDLSGLSALTLLEENWQHRDNCINNMDASATQEFAAVWGALAKRYNGVSNRDLSFNLLVEPGVASEEAYAAFFTPAVEAIRAQTPDRCIIADIHSGNLTGESMAKLGVALSYHLYEPRAFCTPSADMTTQEAESAQWPYTDADGNVIDAAQAMNEPGFMSISANELISTARRYNVGVMIGEFGTFGENSQNCWYPIETQRTYLTDMVRTFQAQGVGWCYGAWDGFSGIVSETPLIDADSYEKLEGTPAYLNKDTQALFQEINSLC